MNRMRLVSWLIGVSALAGAIAAPVNAQSIPGGFGSDVTGTNVFSNTALRYGFGAIDDSPIIALIGGAENAIATLINSGAISGGTQISLTTLSERLAVISSEGFDPDGLNQSVRNAAANLSEDLATAQAACDAGGEQGCERLIILVENLNPLLEDLEQLIISLEENARIARTF